MALILGTLAVSYVFMNLLVMRKTRTGQAAVEQYHSQVSGRVGDVLGNVTVVQSYTRLGRRGGGDAHPHGRPAQCTVSGY